MSLPDWLLSRPAMYAGGLVVVLGSAGLLVRSRDARIRREEAARVRIERLEIAREQQDSANAMLRDSLVVVQERSDSAKVQTQAGVNTYQRTRAGVNDAALRPSSIPTQPAGLPPGMVLVPVAYVEAATNALAALQAADSLSRLVTQLMAAGAQERAISEARIAGLITKDSLNTVLITQLQIAIAAARPGLADKAKWAAVGTGVYLVGREIVRALSKQQQQSPVIIQ